MAVFFLNTNLEHQLNKLITYIFHVVMFFLPLYRPRRELIGGLQTMAEQQKVILRRAQVLALVGMSQSAMYALIADGEFPRPITLSGRSSRRPAVGWVSTEIMAWIEERITLRDLLQ